MMPRQKRTLLRAALVFYFFAGLLALLTPQREVFPFFSWFLFPFTPNPGVQYQLKLDLYAGDPVEPPLFYREAAGRVAPVSPIDVFTATQRLGQAIEANRDTEVREARRQLEGGLLTSPVRYRVIRIERDPVLEFKTGQRSQTVIGVFSTEPEL